MSMIKQDSLQVQNYDLTVLLCNYNHNYNALTINSSL
jgi:hypothetical protein